MNAHSVQKNNYTENRKNSTIFTPRPISLWLSEFLKPVTDKFKDGDIIFDPSVGGGNLLFPYERFTRVGMDIQNYGLNWLDSFIEGDFLDLQIGDIKEEIPLVLNNPPFNHSKETAQKHGRRNLLPDLFTEKVFELFGKNQKYVLFTPMGFRLNIRCAGYNQGSRYKKLRDLYGKITSICSLPLDVFHNPDFDPHKPEGQKNPKKGIMETNIRRKETQQEIIFFNMPELDPHPMLPDSVLEALRVIDREMA